MLSTNRPIEIASFLDQHQWGDASAEPFDGDFSPRRYARLTRADGATAILMDADPDQKTPQFVRLAHILRERGVNVPEIYAAQPEQGLVLLQDFGVRNVGALLDQGEAPKPYFLRAAEILAHLHRGFERADAVSLDLPLMNTDYFIPQAELFLDAYVPYVKAREASDMERQDFRAAWRAVLRPLDTMPKSLILRDFMPDNLMDISQMVGMKKKNDVRENSLSPIGGEAHRAANGPVDRLQPMRGEGVSALGVLDFQEAGVGCVAYDLSSLCEEVRRDGGFALLPDVVTHYIQRAQTPLSQADLIRACTLFSAQRHTRMLGNVARTAIKRGQQGRLLPYLPRIEKHLQNILTQPYLMPVREWMEQVDVL